LHSREVLAFKYFLLRIEQIYAPRNLLIKKKCSNKTCAWNS